MINIELPVIEEKQETPDVKTVKLGLQEKIDFKPGQYMMFGMGDDETKSLSIASSPTEDFLLFSVKLSDSEFKKRFNSLKVGDKVKVRGPMGIFVLQDAKEIMFLGGGIGITPFRDMIKYACDKKLPTKMTLLYSNKTPADIVYKDEWPLFEKENPNLKIVNTITRPEDTDWTGKTGRINDAMIKEYLSCILWLNER